MWAALRHPGQEGAGWVPPRRTVACYYQRPTQGGAMVKGRAAGSHRGAALQTGPEAPTAPPWCLLQGRPWAQGQEEAPLRPEPAPGSCQASR